ncbi:hypothetical protein [Vibrio harveyi]|uniref:hypothetical protein n=1 Tax=Vibrio harveyi TaxID=669 RepID=UPI0018F1B496|nr:hypothetical protein [Vibrio harveyi]
MSLTQLVTKSLALIALSVSSFSFADVSIQPVGEPVPVDIGHLETEHTQDNSRVKQCYYSTNAGDVYVANVKDSEQCPVKWAFDKVNK